MIFNYKAPRAAVRQFEPACNPRRRQWLTQKNPAAIIKGWWSDMLATNHVTAVKATRPWRHYRAMANSASQARSLFTAMRHQSDRVSPRMRRFHRRNNRQIYDRVKRHSWDRQLAEAVTIQGKSTDALEPRRRTRHPGLLGLSPPSVVRLEWVPGESWGSKQAYRVIHQPVSVVFQYSLNAWLKGLASRDQRRLTGSGSALEACSRRSAIQIHSFITLSSRHYGNARETTDVAW